MTLRVDHGEVDRWAATLDEAIETIPDGTRKVVQKGALNIKNDARRRIGGLRHAPAYPSSITYDTKVTSGSVEAEIGPDKGRRQGALGNLLEYGSVKNPPHPHMIPAAEAEAPKFEQAMEDLAAEVLGL